jgi:uncharacterized protein (TIGR03435 family)
MSGGPGTNDPGRITYTRRTLVGLVALAWSLQNDRISGPAWLKDPMFFDVTATMPPDTTKESFQLMLQNLLIDRFHMQLHHETRDFPGYELQLADKSPKLKETVHGGEEAQPGLPIKPQFGSDGSVKLRPGPQSLTMSSRNSTRAYYQAKPVSDLVRQLGGFVNSSTGAKDGAPIPRIVDKTGLTGKYDFSLEFDCETCGGVSAMFRNLPAFAGRGDAPAQQEPDPGSGLPNVFVALEKQLGLKLVKVKDVPTDILVIDRADKTPAGN